MSTATGVEQKADSVTESVDLASFGYTQQLHRRLGSYASFAAGFSFVSILTTVFQLFWFGFSFGGGAFFWTWPLVFRRSVPGRAELLRAGGAIPHLRGHLSVVQPALERHRRLVRRLDHDPGSDRHHRGRSHRHAGRAAADLGRLPADRHRPVTGFGRRRGQCRAARGHRPVLHHGHQRDRGAADGSDQLGRGHPGADRCRGRRRPAVRPRRAWTRRAGGHRRARVGRRLRRGVPGLVLDGGVRHGRIRQCR